MPFTSHTPGLVPHFDVTVHIVLDDFGKAGRVYRETGEEDTTSKGGRNAASVFDGRRDRFDVRTNSRAGSKWLLRILPH